MTITEISLQTITDSESLKLKIIITGSTPKDNEKKEVEIAALLKYLSNFWKTFKILLINCEISVNLTWPDDCVIFDTATCATQSDNPGLHQMQLLL